MTSSGNHGNYCLLSMIENGIRYRGSSNGKSLFG